LPQESILTAHEWRLCRARHNRHYAEFRIMPSGFPKALVVGLFSKYCSA